MLGNGTRVIEAFVLLLLLMADQLTKLWSQQTDLVIYNKGGIFGVLPSGWWIVVLAVIMSFVIYEWWHAPTGYERWGMSFLMIGGFSNIIDRLMFGAVRDFIYYHWFGFYGNVADIILAVGVIVIIFSRMKQ